MIETVISALIEAKIEKIFVVVGYLKEQFKYLKEKYSNLELIENPYYETVNNISSIYVACEKLRLSDCFICEADLFVSDKNIFKEKTTYSGYFGKMVKGKSDDWVFDLDQNDFITRVGKYGENCFNMVGLSYFTKNDAEILANSIEKAYGKNGYEDLFWDDVVNNNLDKLRLKIHPVENSQLIEIDTVEELKTITKEVQSGSRKIN